jgi:hypothetical protein
VAVESKSTLGFAALGLIRVVILEISVEAGFNRRSRAKEAQLRETRLESAIQPTGQRAAKPRLTRHAL